MELKKTLEENFVEEISADKRIDEKLDNIGTEIKPSKIGTYFEILKKILFVFLGMIFFGMFFYKFSDDIIGFVGTLGVLIVVYFRKKQWLISLFNKPSKKIEKKELNRALIILIFVPILINLIHLLINKESFENAMTGYDQTFSSKVDFFNIVNILILAPLGEEIFFRGYILNKLKTVHKPIVAIVITGIIFALFHGTLLQKITIWVAGLIYGYFAHKTGNIKLSICAHFLGNFMALMFIYREAYNINENWNYVLAVLNVLILYFGVHVFNKKTREILDESLQETTQKAGGLG